mmetsp:Transcript_74297/g.140171  ORF Transcript_74297/g.140171 Transcript_74297/m.140171 type:complete len:120 (+) Transcript_74297:70-429(+)
MSHREAPTRRATNLASGSSHLSHHHGDYLLGPAQNGMSKISQRVRQLRQTLEIGEDARAGSIARRLSRAVAGDPDVQWLLSRLSPSLELGVYQHPCSCGAETRMLLEKMRLGSWSNQFL